MFEKSGSVSTTTTVNLPLDFFSYNYRGRFWGLVDTLEKGGDAR